MPEDYVSAPVATVHCPRCGQPRDAPVVAHVENRLEFAAVCSTPIERGGVCSTTLQLTVTAHVFPTA